MTVVTLALFLVTPVSGLLLASVHQENISNPGQKIWNLKMIPETRRLSFQHWDNVTDFECLVDGTPERPSEKSQVPGSSSCRFDSLPVCKAKNYTVRETRTRQVHAFIIYPPPDGIQGAEAQNFRCWVQMFSLTCSWTVGPAAPRDIQYELSWEDQKKNKVYACPNYTRDAQGVRIRCDFRDVSKEIKIEGEHCFRVNGTSRSGSIPCVDTTCHKWLKEIEDLQAENLTFHCNGSDSRLTWTVRNSSQISFDFEVEIKKGKEKPEISLVKEATYLSQAYETKFEARIRVRSKSFNYWSSWGESQPFECKTKLDGHNLGFWLPASLGVVCAVLATVVAWVIWSRSSLQQKLFPPIPKLRDLVRDAEDLAEAKQDCAEDEEKVEIVGSA